MRLLNTKHPLWLPQGTVQAIVILMITVTNMVLLLKFALYKEEMPQTVAKIMDATIMANVMLIQNYINDRRRDKDGQKTG